MDDFVKFVLFLCICYVAYKQWDKRKRSQRWIAIGKDLNVIANNLTLDDEFIREAKKVAQITFEHVKQHGSRRNLKIGRTIIAGSFGKGTGIKFKRNGKQIQPDLDLIVYINGAKPQFDKELKILEEILEQLNEVSNLVVTRYSLKFNFETKLGEKIKVDLLPAENHAVNTQQLRGQSIGELQARYTRQDLIRQQKTAIKKTGKIDQKVNKLRSSSLTEVTVTKIIDKVADPYVWNVVKLAKYWNSLIDMRGCGYVPARSCIIELIAISALKAKSQDCEDYQNNLYRGFKFFLQTMRDFDKLDVSLENKEDSVELEYSLPMIRDPGNALNNLAEGVPEEAVKLWEEHAREALKVLNKYMFMNPFFYSLGLYGNAIDDIFSHKYERSCFVFLYDVTKIIIMQISEFVKRRT